MKSLKAGMILLSIWSGLNLLVALVVTATVLAGRSPLALSLVFTNAEIAHLDKKAVAVINAQAAIANPSLLALCVLVLAIVWTSLAARSRWAFWALTGSLLPLQAFGFVSDSFLGHRELVANCISTMLLVAGLALAGHALHRQGIRT